MESKPYLIFQLGGLTYAVEAFSVQEIFSLPSLTPIVEAPPEVVGVLNLRGDLLPVIDPNIRFGYPPNSYSIHDAVIVLKTPGSRFGILVNEVCEVQMISPGEIVADLSENLTARFRPEPQPEKSGRTIAGYAKIEDDIVMLFDPESFRDAMADSDLETESQSESDVEERPRAPEFEPLKGHELPVFCPDATPEERQIFRDRAQNLRRKTRGEELAGLMPLAVIGLNGEYFGVSLSMIREFTDIHNITPVPCTPPHIVGNMNLRGEIVTLIDIRGTLGLPMDGDGHSKKAAIVKMNDLVTGVTVNDIFDVAYLNRASIRSVPAALRSIQDEYLRGTAVYRDRMMSLLDLEKILAQGTLIVDEEV
ncbi:chemotaxis protein CheW [Lyngbya sp. CCY1209]|jgi:purine-binding chemotaxis protein CheW|uniref:chemotaxis protein CheW n=1 Tax=Lyngbya sp. CCY1209 TaxID=2886103 RepID=UPI002D215694|nr:chemotaxis protein CheW [Lyngbya sp. CCY1209]MEB3883290.1 chemotaxis protein CheW [Lyngbya sp. CCY1209]